MMHILKWRSKSSNFKFWLRSLPLVIEPRISLNDKLSLSWLICLILPGDRLRLCKNFSNSFSSSVPSRRSVPALNVVIFGSVPLDATSVSLANRFADSPDKCSVPPAPSWSKAILMLTRQVKFDDLSRLWVELYHRSRHLDFWNSCSQLKVLSHQLRVELNRQV